ncbi:MAG: hypothetical protein F4077_03710 [Gammaproteobacteria bacterium]|nr:hypothetical protein [Gammaproteobacteria bacterium]MYI76856.1 hypothetical protein [Gammaproteobacteria bacterium]
MKYYIDLTEHENNLAEKIDFGIIKQTMNEVQEAYHTNQEPIVKLMRSLLRRGAIPRQRMLYWEDPEYNTGGYGKSRREVFERNGTCGEDIYIHIHFLTYLYYFLFGSTLPNSVIEKFEKQVGNPEWISSSDILLIEKYVRSLVREHDLEKDYAAEEFFKLSLDIGLDVYYARRVRDSVKRMPRGGSVENVPGRNLRY